MRLKHWGGLVFVLPALAILLGLIAWPILEAIRLSLTDARVGTAGDFVGLANYRSLLRNSLFLTALFNSVLFTVTAVFLKTVLGLLAALQLNRSMRGMTWIRGALLLPWVIPSTFSVLAWLWLFDYRLGALNWVLQQLGLAHSPLPWLSDPLYARISVILVNVWRGLPFFAISILAALVSIPKDLHDAAEIDGASGYAKFRWITLPLIAPTLYIVILFSVVMTISDFNVVYVLTKGGPQNATHVFATLAYQSAFANGELGVGAAISLFVFPVLLLSMFFLLRLVQRKEVA